VQVLPAAAAQSIPHRTDVYVIEPANEGQVNPICIYIFIYISMCVCAYVYIYVNTFMYIYICTLSNLNGRDGCG